MDDEILAFGPFQLFPKARLLLSAGKQIRLGTRALDVLIALAQRAGEIVTKKELLDRVWPGYPIDEGALRVHLSALRKVLGRAESGNQYIANAQGRGYVLTAPVRLTQSRPDGSTAEATPLARPPRVPFAATRVIGRGAILSTLDAKLRRTRFLSIVGPGGIGKTTVALKLAESLTDEFTDGELFFDFALLTDPLLVPSTIANAVGLTLKPENPISGLVTFFSGKKILLILDNCEHVIDATAALAEHLSGSVPTLTILATSREPLRARGEWVHRLPPLSFPSTTQNLTATEAHAYSAIELLLERVTATVDAFSLSDEDVPVAVELCKRLEGNPLAIELAAASIETFGLRGATSRLQDWFSTLNLGHRTASTRHQTLYATLEWSYDLLSETEKLVFERLAIFQGKASLEMMIEVVSDDAVPRTSAPAALYNLHTKSLLAADFGDEAVEYRLLETTRAHALQKLKCSGDYNRIARRHAEVFCRHFEMGDSDWEAQPLTEWLGSYGKCLDDARSALTWAFSPAGDPTLGFRLLASSAHLWLELPLAAEYRTRVEQALRILPQYPDTSPAIEMRLCLTLAHALWTTEGPGPHMIELCQRGLRLASLQHAVSQQMQAYWGIWHTRSLSGDPYDMQIVADECRLVADKSDDPVIRLASERLSALSLHYLGDQAKAWHHHALTLGYSDSAFRRIRRFGFHVDQKLATKTLESRILWLRGYPDQALQTALDGIDYAIKIDHAVALAYFLGLAACPIAIWYGDLRRAREFVERLNYVAVTHSLEYWHGLGRVYSYAISQPTGSSSDGLNLSAGTHYSFYELELFATLRDDMAVPEVLARCETQESGWWLAEVLRVKGMTIPTGVGDSRATAEALFRRSLDTAHRQDARAWHLRAATSLARLLGEQNRPREAYSILDPSYRRFSEGHKSIDLVNAKAVLEKLGAAL